MLDVPQTWVRTFDLSSFTGDAWGLEASLDVPPATVPRFVSDGSPLRWAVVGMDGRNLAAEPVTNTVTSFGTRVLKINRTSQGKGVPYLLSTTSGTNVNKEFTETDMSPGDVFVLAVVSLTAGGSTDFLWVYPVAGAQKLESGVAP